MRNLYLYHHGIKGQRWGTRRFQNEDGSLTSVGKKRYDVDVGKAIEKRNAAKNDIRKAENIQKRNKAREKFRYTKHQVDNEKIKENLNKETNKSKRRLKLEQEYIKKGLTEEEAAIAAYKRTRTEKTIATVSAVAITAAAAYVAYKHYDRTVDRVIKAGTELQNISNNSNMGVKDAFYFSMNNRDNQKYRGIFSKWLQSNRGVSDIYETKIKVTKDIKVASEKTILKTLREMEKEDTYTNPNLKDHISLRLMDIIEQNNNGFMSPKKQKVMNKGLDSLMNNKIDGNVYKALNIALVDHHNSRSQETIDRIYKALSDKGYGAIADINDKYYSGYNAKNPMIAFNMANNLAVKKVRKLSENDITDAYDKSIQMFKNEETTKTALASLSAVGLVAAGTYITRNIKENRRYADIINK